MNGLLDNPVVVDVDLDDRRRSEMEPEVASYFEEFVDGYTCPTSAVGFGALEFDFVADEDDSNAFDWEY